MLGRWHSRPTGSRVIWGMREFEVRTHLNSLDEVRPSARAGMSKRGCRAQGAGQYNSGSEFRLRWPSFTLFLQFGYVKRT